MQFYLVILAALFSLVMGVYPVSPAHSATCGKDGGGFAQWLSDFTKEARSQGISPSTLKALSGISYHKTVIKLDRGQKRSSRTSFAKYAKRKLTYSRIKRGKKLLKQHGKLLKVIERKYGVPGPILLALWGLETDYGTNKGKMNTFRSLATLAYDCRRSAFFTNELYAALNIVQKGYMKPSVMKGAWAGELGHTQFLASSYLRHAVDFDRNGRRDLVNSVPDALASTANYLKNFGWKPGPYGPGSSNARVLAAWNKSINYQKVIPMLAEKIAD